MKLFIAFLFTFLIVSGSYSQKNINHPTVSAGPPGLKLNTFTGSIIYERQDLEIPCQGLHIFQNIIDMTLMEMLHLTPMLKTQTNKVSTRLPKRVQNRQKF